MSSVVLFTSGADAKDTRAASSPQFLFSTSTSVELVTTSGHALTMASFTSPEAPVLPAMSSGSAPVASGCLAACGGANVKAQMCLSPA